MTHDIPWDAMQPIYLDYNATTPIDPEVAAAMLPYIREHFGNPSSTHAYGVAGPQGCREGPRAGGGAAQLPPRRDPLHERRDGVEQPCHQRCCTAHRSKGNHIITSAFEHPAVTEVCEYLAADGFDITCVPVDAHGIIDLEALEKAITERTFLISVMHANNEVGTIQPIAEIASMARKRGILVHTDAAQSAGKIPVDAAETGRRPAEHCGAQALRPEGRGGALHSRRECSWRSSCTAPATRREEGPVRRTSSGLPAWGRPARPPGATLRSNMDRTKRTRDRLRGGTASGRLRTCE